MLTLLNCCSFQQGYLHVVYNGSFYYHQQADARVIRYELNTERNTMVKLPNATIAGDVFLYEKVINNRPLSNT